MIYASLEDALLNGYEAERPYICQAHGDHNASASLNGLTGAYFCYACGDKGKVDLDHLPISEDGIEVLIDELDHLLSPIRHRYPERYLDRFDADGMGSYWSARFTKATGRHYRLGHATGVATYPLRDNSGTLIGVVERDLTGDKPWKYKYPDGSKTSDLLFDIHRVTTPQLILCEGATDAMAVRDTGLDIDATACYGARLSARQATLIKKYDPSTLWVAFDMDKAGANGFKQLQETLGFAVPIRRMLWSGYKDLSEMPLSVRTKFLKTVTGVTERQLVTRSHLRIVLDTCSKENSKKSEELQPTG